MLSRFNSISARFATIIAETSVKLRSPPVDKHYHKRIVMRLLEPVVVSRIGSVLVKVCWFSPNSEEQTQYKYSEIFRGVVSCNTQASASTSCPTKQLRIACWHVYRLKT